MWNTITQRMTIARLASMGLGSILIAVSLLVGAPISPAAANDRGRAHELSADVDPGYAVIERDATDDMRLVASAPSRFTGVNGLAGRQPTMRSGSCDIVFEGDPLLFQTEHGRNQFIVDPWREQCSTSWTEVVAPNHDHLHLDFQHPDIGPCFEGPLAGQYAIIDGDDCIDFDPLTEPRIAPRSHSGDQVVELRMYDADGYRNFRFDRIRVVSGPIRVCVHETGAIRDKIVMNGGSGTPNATCWNLDEGYWNLSGHDVDARLVTLTGPAGASGPFAFDDIRITER